MSLCHNGNRTVGKLRFLWGVLFHLVWEAGLGRWLWVKAPAVIQPSLMTKCDLRSPCDGGREITPPRMDLLVILDPPLGF